MAGRYISILNFLPKVHNQPNMSHPYLCLGALPPSSLSWFRICQKGIENCFEPTLFFANESSCIITQGALGDTYFANALRSIISLFASLSYLSSHSLFLSCPLPISQFSLLIQNISPVYLSQRDTLTWVSIQSNFVNKERLFVSNASSSPFFSHDAQWRYVHIDDRIACRQSGRVHFCRNDSINETFVMLLEKAYAKLHGCYESLLHGLLEKCLQDLTACAHVKVLRKELISNESKLVSALIDSFHLSSKKSMIISGKN
jgi:hypothetical protein